MTAGGTPPQGLITTDRVKLSIIQSQSPGLQQFGPLAQSIAETKNRAALSALANLGQRGVGSRSLGEVVQEADQAHLRGHLDAAMDLLSGDNAPNGTLMARLAELGGFDAALAPRIVVRWSDRAVRMSAEHVTQVADLVQRSILRSTPELSQYVARQLGLSDEVIAAQSREVETVQQPLPVGSLTASLAIMQALVPAAPQTPMASAAAVQLLVAAGIAPTDAQAMVDAQRPPAAPVTP
jgi:hypothetical protein